MRVGYSLAEFERVRGLFEGVKGRRLFTALVTSLLEVKGFGEGGDPSTSNSYISIIEPIVESCLLVLTLLTVLHWVCRRRSEGFNI